MTSRLPRPLPFVLALLALVGVLAPGVPSEAQPVPVAPESGSSDWTTVDAGGLVTCGIRSSRRLYCWGDGTYGQIGNGTTTTSNPTPVEVAGGHRDWTAVAVGDYHVCGIRNGGRLYCWGEDYDGQLGNGAPLAEALTPGLVSGGVTDRTSVSAGTDHTCARRANGRLSCWGDDGDGRLGNGLPAANRSTPTPVAGGITNWTSVSAGGSHTCARRANGTLFCWGDDGSGRLGNGLPEAERAAPSPVAGGITNWTSVTAGNFHTCAHRANGRLYCWGDDETEGQLGTAGPNTDRAVPTLVSGGITNWTGVTAGRWHACGRRAPGRLLCWGQGNDGQVGDGGFLGWNFPVPVAGGASDWGQLTAGDYHTCARTVSGRLYCWGDDLRGQLGTVGANTDAARPTEVYVP